MSASCKHSPRLPPFPLLLHNYAQIPALHTAGMPRCTFREASFKREHTHETWKGLPQLHIWINKPETLHVKSQQQTGVSVPSSPPHQRGRETWWCQEDTPKYTTSGRLEVTFLCAQPDLTLWEKYFDSM